MINGEFKYVNGWYAIFVGTKGTIERHGPYGTEQQAREERLKLTHAKDFTYTRLVPAVPSTSEG